MLSKLNFSLCFDWLIPCKFGHTSIGESFALGLFFHLGRGEPAWTADESRVDWASQLEHVNLLEATQHFGDTEMGSSVHCQV